MAFPVPVRVRCKLERMQTLMIVVVNTAPWCSAPVLRHGGSDAVSGVSSVAGGCRQK